jgi:hypothetical protein
MSIVSADIYQRFGNALRLLAPGFNMSDDDIEFSIGSDGFDNFALSNGHDIAEIIEAALLISRIRTVKGG